MSTVADQLDAQDLRAADRERRKRENELLLLLLLFMDQAERETKIAVVHGLPFSSVLQSIIAGNPNTGHRGVVRMIARASAQAFRDGYRRAGLMADTRDLEREHAGRIADLIELYRSSAVDAATAMVATLTDAVQAAVTVARAAGEKVKGLRQAVSDAFDRAGYSRSNPYALDLGAERQIVSAHNAGIIAGGILRVPSLTARAVGLRHCSVIDNATTPICRERDGLQLPADHPYWLRNIPSLHNRCRSMLRVLPGEYDMSETLPTIPPAPGFGMAPPGFLEALMRRPQDFGDAIKDPSKP